MTVAQIAISILWITGGYLIGSVCCAILVCSLWGLPDPRGEGSRNPGATNVLRIGGKIPAVVTLLGDFLKGYLPVALAAWMGLPSFTLAGIMLAAFLGHLYPIFFRFKGGKGVATSLGVLCGLSPIVGSVAVGSWLAMAVVFRISSLASLATAAISPLVTWQITQNPTLTLGVGILGAFQWWRHRANIGNLLAGREPKIGSRDAAH